MVRREAVVQGKTSLLLSETPTGAGTAQAEFTLESDSVLVSVYVASISGTLDVVVTSETQLGREITIITFPQLNSNSTELLLRKPAVALSNCKVTATYSDACSFEVYARGIGAGETSVVIQGQATATTTQVNVPTGAPTNIIPASLADRSGIMLVNNNAAGIVYLGFSAAEATLGNGFPVFNKAPWIGDLKAGVGLWGVADTVTVDVRIQQAGG